MGDVEKLEGHFAQAKTFYTESLELKVLVKDKAGLIYSLEAFAQLATAQEQYKRAAPIANTRAQLGERAFITAWTEGQKMTREQAVEYALRTASH